PRLTSASSIPSFRAGSSIRTATMCGNGCPSLPSSQARISTRRGKLPRSISPLRASLSARPIHTRSSITPRRAPARFPPSSRSERLPALDGGEAYDGDALGLRIGASVELLAEHVRVDLLVAELARVSVEGLPQRFEQRVSTGDDRRPAIED